MIKISIVLLIDNNVALFNFNVVFVYLGEWVSVETPRVTPVYYPAVLLVIPPQLVPALGK